MRINWNSEIRFWLKKCAFKTMFFLCDFSSFVLSSWTKSEFPQYLYESLKSSYCLFLYLSLEIEKRMIFFHQAFKNRQLNVNRKPIKMSTEHMWSSSERMTLFAFLLSTYDSISQCLATIKLIFDTLVNILDLFPLPPIDVHILLRQSIQHLQYREWNLSDTCSFQSIFSSAGLVPVLITSEILG